MDLLHIIKTIVLLVIGFSYKNTFLLGDDHSFIVDIAYYLALIWLVHKYSMSYKLPKVPETDFNVCIIGAGFSGIGVAVKLKEMGVKFRIIEKGSQPGETWWDNQYPGCACDVASHMYRYIST